MVVVKIVMGRAAAAVKPVSAGRHATAGNEADLSADRTEQALTALPITVTAVTRDQVTSAVMTAPVPTADQVHDRALDRDPVTETAVTAALSSTRDHDLADLTARGPDPVTSEVCTGPDLTADRTRDRADDRDPVTETDPTADPLAEFDHYLVALGREVMTDLTDRDEAVNRGTFAMALRGRGVAIATNKAGALLRGLKQVAA